MTRTFRLGFIVLAGWLMTTTAPDASPFPLCLTNHGVCQDNGCRERGGFCTPQRGICTCFALPGATAINR